MTVNSESGVSFDAGISRARDPLAATATSLVAEAESRDAPGTLVIVVRPAAHDYCVFSADGGNGALRAAVSVTVASENQRLWSDVGHREMVEHRVDSLPEIVRAAAEGAGVSTVHLSTVRSGDALGAVALWFDDDDAGVPDAAARADTIDVLDAAARRYLTLAAADASRAAESAGTSRSAGSNGSGADQRGSGRPAGLPVGSEDPDIDALTGLASKARFDRAIDEFEGEEATLLLIDLDHFTSVIEEHGREAGDAVLREIARRLAGACRSNDLIARLGNDEFAVVLDGTDRHTGLQVSKRLLTQIAEPLPDGIGPGGITATLAFAHELGLVDMEELVEMADDAIASGKRAGRGRIVVAS